jgi:hypothetical protein
MHNIYYDPGKFGLTIVGEIGELVQKVRRLGLGERL